MVTDFSEKPASLKMKKAGTSGTCKTLVTYTQKITICTFTALKSSYLIQIEGVQNM
jgi:hypothetical protein